MVEDEGLEQPVPAAAGRKQPGGLFVRARESPCGSLLWAQKGFLANRIESIRYDRYFNSHPCVRGDRPGRRRPQIQSDFNSRPCVRGDVTTFYTNAEGILFQFTPLREGRPALRASDKRSKIFQFTSQREGRRSACCLDVLPACISIHAPARGATCCFPACRKKGPYFNSRPCVRGDRPSFGCCPSARDFNSRPCVRGDPVRHRKKVRCWAHFNSRPYVRGDVSWSTSAPSRYGFQFTPLREGRLSAVLPRSRIDRFQFTPLREGRQMQHNAADRENKFQFTPLREGRRDANSKRTTKEKISIHAPA